MLDPDLQTRRYLWLAQHNRGILADLDITLLDIANALVEQGIDPSPATLEKVAHSLRRYARAVTHAWLQDEKDWASWLEA